MIRVVITFILIASNSSAFPCSPTIPLPFQDAIIESLGSNDCSRGRVSTSAKAKACDCVSNYYKQYPSAPKLMLNPKTKSMLQKKAYDLVKTNLLSISSDITSLGADGVFTQSDIGNECNIEKNLSKLKCTISPSFKNKDDKALLVKSFINEIKNGYRSHSSTNRPFLKPALIDRSKKFSCDIPDSVVYDLSNRAQNFAVQKLAEYLKSIKDYIKPGDSIESILRQQALSANPVDKSLIENLLISSRLSPRLAMLVDDPSFLTDIAKNNFDNQAVQQIFKSQKSKEQLHNKIIKSCKETFANIESLICSNPDDVLPREYRPIKEFVREKFNPRKSLEGLVKANSDLRLFCSNKNFDFSKKVQRLKNNLSSPLDLSGSFEKAIIANYNFRIGALKSKSVDESQSEETSSGLNLCSFIPTPDKPKNTGDYEKKIQEKCSGDNKFTTACFYAKAVKVMYGDRLDKINKTKAAIAKAKTTTGGSKKKIKIDGVELDLADAQLNLDNQIANLFKEHKTPPKLVRDFIATKENPSVEIGIEAAPAASESREQVASKTKTKTASGDGFASSNSNDGSFVAGAPSTSNDSNETAQRRSNSSRNSRTPVQSQYEKERENRISQNMQKMYKEVARKMSVDNDADLARMNGELNTLKKQANSHSNNNQNGLTDTMRNALQDPAAQEYYDSFDHTDPMQEELERIADNTSPFTHETNFTKDNSSGPTEEEISSNKALGYMADANTKSRKAKANKKAGRGPASSGRGSAGVNITQVDKPSANGTNYGENSIEEIEIDKDIDIAFGDIVDMDPETAQKLLSILDNEKTSEFYIKHGGVRILIKKTGKTFYVDQGNVEPDQRKLLNQILSSASLKENFQGLVRHLKRGLKESKNVQVNTKSSGYKGMLNI